MSASRLVFLCATALLVSSAVSAQEARLEALDVIPGAAEAPLVPVPGGFLYAKRVRKEGGERLLFSLFKQGKSVELFDGGISSERALMLFLHPGLSSSDGERYLFPRRISPQSQRWTAVVVGPSGRLPLEGGGEVAGMAWLGDRPLILEGPWYRTEEAHSRLYLYDKTGKTRREVADFPREGGYGLKVAPGGKHAAFFVQAQGTNRENFRLRIVNLSSFESQDTPGVGQLDCLPAGFSALSWDPKGESVIYRDAPAGDRSKLKLMRAYPSGKTAPLCKVEGATSWTSLDEGHVVIGTEPDLKHMILRLSDGQIFPLSLPEGESYVVGGRGRILVVSTAGKPRVTRLMKLVLPGEEEGVKLPTSKPALER